jgi:DNA-binding transcriptional regulator YdaS (Cro superfamily)
MLTDHDWELITKAAFAMGLQKDAPRKWRERDRIPADRVPEVARRTKISMKRLRPDLYPPEAA